MAIADIVTLAIAHSTVKSSFSLAIQTFYKFNPVLILKSTTTGLVCCLGMRLTVANRKLITMVVFLNQVFTVHDQGTRIEDQDAVQ